MASHAIAVLQPACVDTAQAPRPFSNTLRNNILFGLDRTDDEIYAATKLAVMDHDLEELGDTLETMAGARGAKLSGGQAPRADLRPGWHDLSGCLASPSAPAPGGLHHPAQRWARGV